MSSSIKLVECPRDAWQGLPGAIPAGTKAAYLRALIDAGFRHIDAVSFVSPTSVPQMADSERVLELLRPPVDIDIIGIVVNSRGAERAIATAAVHTLGFPYSISPEFLRRNQRQTPAEAIEAMRTIAALARQAGLNTAAYISMAFGNPYGEAWSTDAVVDACSRLMEEGVEQISLADTVGLATPQQIADTTGAALTAHPGLEIGAHLHARREDAAAKVRAAYHAGCRRFDAAMAGLGGCPFAQDALVGNLPTEILVETLRACGAELPELKPLDALLAASAEIAPECGVAAHGEKS